MYLTLIESIVVYLGETTAVCPWGEGTRIGGCSVSAAAVDGSFNYQPAESILSVAFREKGCRVRLV